MVNSLSSNPLFHGWYADPEIHCFQNRYYIYPSISAPYHEGTWFECWSSDDLTNWCNEGKTLDLADVRWSTNYAAWAPSVAEKNGRYYFYFSAGDGAGIGVAVSDSPTGPFRDAIGIPLVCGYPHGAQPIDAHCFQDDDGEAYLYFGGHNKCAVALLNPTMISFRSPFRDVTPSPDYREGPFMIKRGGVYYFMWSEGEWTNDTYRAAYGTANHPYGPFKYGGKILVNNPAVAKSAGHHSVMRLPNTEDEWIVCYHRRPLDATSKFHRVVCAERLEFRADGSIATAVLTHEGVPVHPARAAE